MPSVRVALSTSADGSMYDPANQTNQQVIANRVQWFTGQGAALDDTVRVHVTYDGDDFCRYRIVGAEQKGEGMRQAAPQFSDGLVTTEPGVALFLPIADCVATTLFDEEKGVLMLSHLGRHSLEQDGGVRSVQFLVDQFGVTPANLKVWLSPAPSKVAYPIFKLGNVSMKEAVHEQLSRAGISPENITDNLADTATDDTYFSHTAYLKGGKSSDGRFAMLSVMAE